jgi:hypothetical protein
MLGISPEDGPPETQIDTESEALAVFLAADSNGLGIDMLKAQLLAAKLNALKYTGFAGAYLPDGQKVGDVIADADQLLDDVANGATTDKGTVVILKDLLDAANNNGEGQQVLRTCTFPPPTIERSLYDYDGDGFTNESEGWYIGTNAMKRCGAGNWPADLNQDGTSVNKMDILDVLSFVAPVRHFGTSTGHPFYDKRWDLAHGPASSDTINIQDLTTLFSGPTGFPPMFGGGAAYGRTCSP